jgi:hypothetical protein
MSNACVVSEEGRGAAVDCNANGRTRQNNAAIMMGKAILDPSTRLVDESEIYVYKSDMIQLTAAFIAGTQRKGIGDFG